MALDTQQQIVTYDAPKKDLYALGEMPPLGHVPKQMYAWAIRRERHGPPEEAMKLEVVDTWALDSNEVLVMVMAAGVNYNGVWAGLGQPISPFDNSKLPYFIVGSDAAGIVWAVGDKVKRWKVGDEVVIHCNQDDGDDEECNGGDPMFSPSQRIWGYETHDGSFAQFTRVQAQREVFFNIVRPGLYWISFSGGGAADGQGGRISRVQIHARDSRDQPLWRVVKDGGEPTPAFSSWIALPAGGARTLYRVQAQ